MQTLITESEWMNLLEQRKEAIVKASCNRRKLAACNNESDPGEWIRRVDCLCSEFMFAGLTRERDKRDGRMWLFVKKDKHQIPQVFGPRS
jgi:hypothetical protein